jgi:hypothetical protein
MIKELIQFKKAALNLNEAWEFAQSNGFSREGGGDLYPFEVDFEEVSYGIKEWVDQVKYDIYALKETKYFMCLKDYADFEKSWFYQVKMCDGIEECKIYEETYQPYTDTDFISRKGLSEYFLEVPEDFYELAMDFIKHDCDPGDLYKLAIKKFKKEES